MTVEISEFAESEQLHIIGLHPNATYLMQPLDVSFFHPMKNNWRNFIRRKMLNLPGFTIKKTNFAKILSEFLACHEYSTQIISGFRSCGLFPLNSAAIDGSKIVKKKPNVQNFVNAKQQFLLGAMPNYYERSQSDVGPTIFQVGVGTIISQGTVDQVLPEYSSQSGFANVNDLVDSNNYCKYKHCLYIYCVHK